MLSKVIDRFKDRTATLIADYLFDELFNTVVLPLVSLLGPVLTLLGLKLLSRILQRPTPSWLFIVFLVIYFIAGIMIGWRLRTVLVRRANLLKNQAEDRAFEIFCFYSKGRVPDHVDVHRRIHSRRKRPIKRVPIVVGYYTKSGYRGIKVNALDYGKIDNIRPTKFQRLSMDFVLDDELQPNANTELSYRITTVNRKEEPPPYQTVRAIFAPIKEARITVRFAPDALPKRVWRAQWLEGIEGEPELLGDSLEPVRGSTYETTFRNLPGGLNIAYGLYWDW